MNVAKSVGICEAQSLGPCRQRQVPVATKILDRTHTPASHAGRMLLIQYFTPKQIVRIESHFRIRFTRHKR